MPDTYKGQEMSAEERADLKRAEKGRNFWKPYCLAGWQLSGWTDDHSALFVRNSVSLDMQRGHVEIIRQAEAAARKKALEETELIALGYVTGGDIARKIRALAESTEP